MNPILNKIKGWWLAATPTQRLTTLGGGALSLVLLAAIASYAGRPKYTLLFGGLSPAEQAGVVSEVQAMNVPVRYDTAGKVEVPDDKAADVTMRLATAGKLPKSGHAGIDELGAMNLYTTPAVERERLKVIAENRLAESIQTSPGIKRAQVHLTLGDPSPFGDQQRPATASVNIIEGGNGMVGSDQAQGIAMLVANAVDGLALKNVVVLNERMEPIFNGSDSVGGENQATKKIDLEDQVGKTEARKLQAALDTMFGPGSTLVTARAEVDLDEEDSTINTRKVRDGAEVEVAKEKAPMGGDGAPAVPAGMAANTGTPGAPTASGTATGGKGNYENVVKRIEPGYTDTVNRRKKALGGLKRLLINVGANTAKFKDDTEKADFVRTVDTFVQNEFKNQTDTASFRAFVTPAKFNDDVQQIATKAQEEATAAAKRQQIISLLPVAALLVVGFFVVKSLGKFGKVSAMGMTPALAGAGGMSLPGGYNAMGGAGTSGLPAGAERGGVAGSPLEAALSGHFDGGNPLGLPEGARRGEDGGIEFESDDERIRITKIKERTSIPLEQIRQMSVERPEAVAMLVKSWLMDEKR